MTTQTVFVPHPLERNRLRSGDHVWTWCSRAMDRTDHLYQPGQMPPLKCLCPLCNLDQDIATLSDTAQD